MKLLFTWIWRKRLVDHLGGPLKVVKVKGWRTALVENRYGSRSTITFLFR